MLIVRVESQITLANSHPTVEFTFTKGNFLSVFVDFKEILLIVPVVSNVGKLPFDRKIYLLSGKCVVCILMDFKKSSKLRQY